MVTPEERAPVGGRTVQVVHFCKDDISVQAFGNPFYLGIGPVCVCTVVCMIVLTYTGEYIYVCVCKYVCIYLCVCVYAFVYCVSFVGERVCACFTLLLLVHRMT